MRLLATVGIGLGGLGSHRLRSILTALGILIGVGAVIVTVGVGQGAQQAVADRISSLGTNLIIVQPGSVSSGGIRGGLGSASTLTRADADALASHDSAPDVAAVAPTAQRQVAMVAGSSNWTSSVVGTTPGWITTRNRDLAEGEMFTDADVRGQARVAVLGPVTAAQLFAGQDPVGQLVTIAGVPMRVVGVLASAGATAVGNQDDQALVPISTAQNEILGGASRSSVQTILVTASSSDAIPAAEQETTAVLLSSHHIADPAQADFQLATQDQLLSTAQSTTDILSVLLASISAVSLLVGGIGVMNIMLVSVTERVREIGLRKAVGATGADIRGQFLVEAGALGLVGGLLGVGLGFLGALLLPRFTPVSVLLSPLSVLGAVAVAALIGLVFGVYPAVRAARLAPIDALRSE